MKPAVCFYCVVPFSEKDAAAIKGGFQVTGGRINKKFREVMQTYSNF